MKPKKKKNLFVQIAKYLIALILLAVLSVVLLFSLVYVDVFGKLPDREQLSSIINEEASIIYSSDKVVLGKIFAENRTSVESNKLPKHLKQALIATEDKRFYEHIGYDSKSYIRVFFKSILMGDRSGGGGSTITQQLIKNLYGRQYAGFLSMPINKIKELITAKRIEEIYTKDEILLLYFNSVPFGEDLYGIEAASQRFFGKPVEALKIEEAAVLVGMLKANTYYNPRLNPKNALDRRNTVLELMQSEKYLTRKACDSLKNIPLRLDYENLEKKSTAGYFVYQVKQKAKRIIEALNEAKGTDYNLQTDGLQVHTTLNYTLQEIAERAAQKQLQIKQLELDQELKKNDLKRQWFKNNGTRATDSLWQSTKMLNASVLLTNPKNGEVLTYVGGNDFKKYPFDMVRSHRQIASAFKPILYTTALEQGFYPCEYLKNEEKTYEEYDNWTPRNYSNQSTPDKNVALWYALTRSMNLPTVDLYFKIKSKDLVYACDRLGFPPVAENTPSVALGTMDLSLSEIVGAYGTFANNGRRNELYMITKITDKKGKEIYKNKKLRPKRVFSSYSTQTTTAILERAINQGTGTKIRTQFNIKSPIAGKTGTAQNFTNAWFVGYTPNLVLGTWVGNSDNEIHFTSSKGSGSSLALPIIGEILKEIENNPRLKRKYLTSFRIPEEIYDSMYCDAYIPDGIKGFVKRIFNKKRTVKPRKESKQKKKKKPKKKKWWQRRRE